MSYCMEMGEFIDWDWESLSNMLTFEEPDFVTLLPVDLNVSKFDNQISRLLSNESNVRDLHINNMWCKTGTYENSHFDSSPCSQFEFPHEQESLFLRNETKLETSFSPEDNQSAFHGSRVNLKAQQKRKYNTLEVEDTSKIKRGKKKVNSEEGDEDMSNATCEKSNGDESNASQESGDGENCISTKKGKMASVTKKGKKRASRGEATNPQSLYARRRRQRINERLSILQNLVPNGTKVDISTMLEEALHYVKFMQLQIKLLSSDELWMYAPLAYNGVDISIYRKISPFMLD